MCTYCFAGADWAQDGAVRGEGAAVHPVVMPPQNLHHITYETQHYLRWSRTPCSLLSEPHIMSHISFFSPPPGLSWVVLYTSKSSSAEGTQCLLTSVQRVKASSTYHHLWGPTHGGSYLWMQRPAWGCHQEQRSGLALYQYDPSDSATVFLQQAEQTVHVNVIRSEGENVYWSTVKISVIQCLQTHQQRPSCSTASQSNNKN